MPRILLAGGLRKRLLLEVLPKLGDRAVGFVTQPVLEKFETVGYRVQALDKREAVVAHARVDGGLPWRGFRILVDQIDAVATDSLRRPVGRDRIFVIDEISEMLLYSKNLQLALQDLFRVGASFLATVGERPVQYIAQLRKLKGAVQVDALDQTIGPAQKRLYRELGLPAPVL
jgi:nucleoside-triphosphatase THEP1